MRHCLALLVLLLSLPLSAAQLHLELGATTRQWSSEELLDHPQARDISIDQDVSYKQPMRYRAVPLAALLDGVSASDHLQAVALDGFADALQGAYDKRLPHLSSLIVSGQLTREEAVADLAKPLYDPKELEIDIAYFCKKMRISRAQFDAFIKAPLRNYREYPNWDRSYRILKRIQRKAERLLGRRINVYS